MDLEMEIPEVAIEGNSQDCHYNCRPYQMLDVLVPIVDGFVGVTIIFIIEKIHFVSVTY